MLETRRRSISRRCAVRAAPAVLAAGALHAALGCGWLPDRNCGAPVPPAPSEPLSAIARAIRYLDLTQLEQDDLTVNRMDYAGDWPQCFAFGNRAPWFREASPFMATFIHHALTQIHPATREALGLSDADLEAAQRMRVRAVGLVERFRAPPECPDAGTFGFWPHDLPPEALQDVLLAALTDSVIPGPDFMGHLGPLNLGFYPTNLAIPTDADDTAGAYAVLLDHHLLDGGPPLAEDPSHFFSDWRDLGQVPRRNNPAWLPAESGAFLTWLAYHNDPANPIFNDVDMIVAINVVNTLGRLGRLETPGVAETIALANDMVARGLHRTAHAQISLYYPDNLFLHYAVARAVSEGGAAGLQPALDGLTQHLLDTAISDDRGVHWDRGDPDLNTAFAVLALLLADRDGPVTDGAIAYLRSRQSAAGSWESGIFFHGRLDNGVTIGWASTALTTGMALEALALHEQRAAEP